jgi:ceroid-lipofuscinosis MFS transporter 7
MSILIMITIFLLSRFFKDRARHQTPKDLKKKSAKRAAIDDHANQLTTFGWTVYDCCILGVMMLNISTKGTIGSFETLGVSIAMSSFGLTASQAGTIVASCGTIGVAALLSMGHLSRFLSDIQLIAGGMLVMALGIMSLTTLDENAENPPWRFIAAIFMIYSVGYPIGHTAVIGLFSKSKYIETSIVW